MQLQTSTKAFTPAAASTVLAWQCCDTVGVPPGKGRSERSVYTNMLTITPLMFFTDRERRAYVYARNELLGFNARVLYDDLPANALRNMAAMNVRASRETRDPQL